MATCTFFGHRECPDSLKSQLKEVLIDLITNHDVDMFYVGNQGQFDTIVRSVLRADDASHPTWVRGLKLLILNSKLNNSKSHPTWVRGLKHHL